MKNIKKKFRKLSKGNDYIYDNCRWWKNTAFIIGEIKILFESKIMIVMIILIYDPSCWYVLKSVTTTNNEIDNEDYLILLYAKMC